MIIFFLACFNQIFAATSSQEQSRKFDDNETNYGYCQAFTKAWEANPDLSAFCANKDNLGKAKGIWNKTFVETHEGTCNLMASSLEDLMTNPQQRDDIKEIRSWFFASQRIGELQLRCTRRIACLLAQLLENRPHMMEATVKDYRQTIRNDKERTEKLLSHTRIPDDKRQEIRWLYELCDNFMLELCLLYRGYADLDQIIAYKSSALELAQNKREFIIQSVVPALCVYIEEPEISQHVIDAVYVPHLFSVFRRTENLGAVQQFAAQLMSTVIEEDWDIAAKQNIIWYIGEDGDLARQFQQELRQMVADLYNSPVRKDENDPGKFLQELNSSINKIWAEDNGKKVNYHLGCIKNFIDGFVMFMVEHEYEKVRTNYAQLINAKQQSHQLLLNNLHQISPYISGQQKPVSVAGNAYRTLLIAARLYVLRFTGTSLDLF